MKRITSIKQLKKLAGREEGLDCFIRLNYKFRSSKHIVYYDEIFYILNEIDESEDELTEEQLFDNSFTLIGEAMLKNQLFEFNY